MKELFIGGTLSKFRSCLQVAQNLYEGVKLDKEEQTGLITYMRTDGVQVGVLYHYKYCFLMSQLPCFPVRFN